MQNYVIWKCECCCGNVFCRQLRLLRYVSTEYLTTVTTLGVLLCCLYCPCLYLPILWYPGTCLHISHRSFSQALPSPLSEFSLCRNRCLFFFILHLYNNLQYRLCLHRWLLFRGERVTVYFRTGQLGTKKGTLVQSAAQSPRLNPPAQGNINKNSTQPYIHPHTLTPKNCNCRLYRQWWSYCRQNGSPSSTLRSGAEPNGNVLIEPTSIRRQKWHASGQQHTILGHLNKSTSPRGRTRRSVERHIPRGVGHVVSCGRHKAQGARL